MTLDGSEVAEVSPTETIGSGASPSLLASISGIGPGDDIGPFGEVVTYPAIPVSVVGQVKISGEYADQGDQVAAFVGDELRGLSDVVVTAGKTYVL